MVTIYDLSKLTGFSPPTVSKALNGTGTISEKTRKKIIAAAKEIGYEPNITARTLRTRRSKLIGIIYNHFYLHHDFRSPFLDTVLYSFRDSVGAENYDLLLLAGPTEMKLNERSFLANTRHIDGILIVSMGPGETELKWLNAYNKPCVSVNEMFAGINAVVTDNREGARTAVQHLVDLGHKKIAYLAGPVTRVSIAARERRQGYHDVLRKNSIKIDPQLETDSDTWHARGGYKACRELLGRNAKFSALFTANNHMAFGAMRYMSEKGIRIPDDISIIGFDDGDSVEEYITPSLSTMRQDSIQIGKIAAEMLLQKLKGSPTERIIHIPAELVQRESSTLIRQGL